MLSTYINLPSKPRLVEEDGNKGIYEVDNLNPGFGHTLGNSLRRIILSSLEGASITSLKIEGADHEFAKVPGVKEDVLNIILNLKRARFKLLTDEPQVIQLSIKGPKVVTASDIEVGGQIEVLNGDQYICEVTGKSEFKLEARVERGIGYASKESMQKQKTDIGHIAVDAVFTPIRRVAYEVENMRVGDKTNHNRLRMTIETDGTFSPREALEKAIEVLIMQLQAIHDFKGLDDHPEELVEAVEKEIQESMEPEKEKRSEEDTNEIMKTRIDTLNLSTRTLNSLDTAKIRTVGGLARKSEDDLLALEGLGEKGVQEIRRALSNFGILLRD